VVWRRDREEVERGCGGGLRGRLVVGFFDVTAGLDGEEVVGVEVTAISFGFVACDGSPLATAFDVHFELVFAILQTVQLFLLDGFVVVDGFCATLKGCPATPLVLEFLEVVAVCAKLQVPDLNRAARFVDHVPIVSIGDSRVCERTEGTDGDDECEDKGCFFHDF